jgi:hypothetical protein
VNDQVKDVALRKRQLIDQSQRKMFLWVAAASVIVGFSLVVAWFLFQNIMYKEKVLAKKFTTVSTLQSNNKIAPELTDNIRVLETNTALNGKKANADDKALQVILDALPASDNTFALGASVQSKLIGGTDDVQLESFSVDQSVVGKKSSTSTNVKSTAFSATISSESATALYDVLHRFELSIRTIDIDSLSLEKGDTKMTLTIKGHAFYLPAKTIQLVEKAVPAK